jgi:hypothetical protein
MPGLALPPGCYILQRLLVTRLPCNPCLMDTLEWRSPSERWPEWRKARKASLIMA